MTASVVDNSGSIGNITISVLPNKDVEVKNNTSISVKLDIRINYSVDKKPDQYENALSHFISPNGVWRIPHKDCYMICIKDVKLKDWKRP